MSCAFACVCVRVSERMTEWAHIKKSNWQWQRAGKLHTHTHAHKVTCTHSHELFKTSFWNTIGKICAFFVAAFFFMLLTRFLRSPRTHTHTHAQPHVHSIAHCHCYTCECVCVYVVAENIVEIVRGFFHFIVCYSHLFSCELSQQHCYSCYIVVSFIFIAPHMTLILFFHSRD